MTAKEVAWVVTGLMFALALLLMVGGCAGRSEGSDLSYIVNRCVTKEKC